MTTHNAERLVTFICTGNAIFMVIHIPLASFKTGTV